MPSKSRDIDRDDSKGLPSESLIARIGGNVMRKLGSPAEYRGVRVYPISADTYRVNVMVGKELYTAKVGNSYFLTADEEGNVVCSSPEITRLY